MYKKTYVEVNLDNIKNNVKTIITKYNKYKYRIGMVKSDAYSHGMYIINSLIESGINYLAVSSLDEAIKIREYNKNIPVLVTEIIDLDVIDTAINENITITIDNISYLKKLKDKKCKIHIKLNTGMNRLGVSSKEEFNELYEYIKSNNNIYLEGIYTHFATPGINDVYYDMQLKRFKDITSDIDIKNIPIVHLSSSFILLNHPKIEFENGFRIGTIMYGYDVSLGEYGTSYKDKLRKYRDNLLIKKNHISPVIRGVNINLKPAFKIKTNIMEIRDVKKGEIIGYGHHLLNKDVKVAVLPIGYESGIGTNTQGRYVLINKKKYEVIDPICMCMMFVIVDENVKLSDEVTVLGDTLTLGYLSRLNNKGIQEMLVNIDKTLPRVYIKNNKIVKEL